MTYYVEKGWLNFTVVIVYGLWVCVNPDKDLKDKKGKLDGQTRGETEFTG